MKAEFAHSLDLSNRAGLRRLTDQVIENTLALPGRMSSPGRKLFRQRAILV